MCTIRSPKPKTDPAEDKDPIYMRNPYLDGLGIGAESRGRNSLRIDLGSPPRTAPPPGSTPPPISQPPPYRPPPGGGTGGPGRTHRDGFPGRILGIAR